MTDLYYAAGLFDGEGCIGVYYNKVTGHHQLRVQVDSTTPVLLDALDEVVPGLRYETKPKGNRKVRWSYTLLGSRAEAFLRIVSPMMRNKSLQAAVALSCDWSSFNSNNPVTPEERLKREEAHDELRKLNARGV